VIIFAHLVPKRYWTQSDWCRFVATEESRVPVDQHMSFRMQLPGMGARQDGKSHQFLHHTVDDAVVVAGRFHAAVLLELHEGLGDAGLVGDGDHPHPAAQ